MSCIDAIGVADVVDLAESLDGGVVALCKNAQAVALLDDVNEAGALVCAAIYLVDLPL